ncbi:26S proteasome regulatory subunit [Cryptosporidium ryanae]|uniref:26S proteasome regulatory subunit n=1 Tax=Cryptosporidium ryanae TaxID=515981 RepID=UPI00351A7816|nr:26S proteasome regulatory subunit [Cryptosporidium ryanae]
MSHQDNKQLYGAVGDAKFSILAAFEKKIVIHPIVLLSIVDHYNRVAKGTSKRVIGTLLGEVQDVNDIHVTNCYALPFDEDSKDQMVWYLDHNYHEQMYLMFKKINTREKILGWYSTGPRIRTSDLEIQELFRNYCPNPIYTIVNVNATDQDFLFSPTSSYISIDEPSDSRILRKKFIQVPCTIGAFEAEEVGVEHLLRDIKNSSISSLVTQISNNLNSCKILISKLKDIRNYVIEILEGRIPPNQNVITTLQDILNLLPDINPPDVLSSFSDRYTDILLTIYGISCLRSVLSLHELINNVSENRIQLDNTSKAIFIKNEGNIDSLT